MTNGSGSHCILSTFLKLSHGYGLWSLCQIKWTLTWLGSNSSQRPMDNTSCSASSGGTSVVSTPSVGTNSFIREKPSTNLREHGLILNSCTLTSLTNISKVITNTFQPQRIQQLPERTNPFLLSSLDQLSEVMSTHGTEKLEESRKNSDKTLPYQSCYSTTKWSHTLSSTLQFADPSSSSSAGHLSSTNSVTLWWECSFWSLSTTLNITASKEKRMKTAFMSRLIRCTHGTLFHRQFSSESKDTPTTTRTLSDHTRFLDDLMRPHITHLSTFTHSWCAYALLFGSTLWTQELMLWGNLLPLENRTIKMCLISTIHSQTTINRYNGSVTPSYFCSRYFWHTSHSSEQWSQ